MKRLSFAAAVAVVAAMLWQPVPAFADACGNDPSCVDPGFGSTPDDGIPSGFVVAMVLVGLVGVGLTAYRVSVARGMAAKSGMDQGDATRVALLDDPGLSATFIASQMHRQGAGPTSAPTSPAHSIADRLRELESLRAQGLVTEEEYAQRRTAILGEV